MPAIIVFLVKTAGPLVLALVVGASVVVLIAWERDREDYSFDDNSQVMTEECSDPVPIDQVRLIGWPTGKNDMLNCQHAQALNTHIFAANIGTSVSIDVSWWARLFRKDIRLPTWQWSACEKYICLIGYDEEILLWDMLPKRLHVATLIPGAEQENPYVTLVYHYRIDKGIVARLLSPR